jgi:hypothetical protein
MADTPKPRMRYKPGFGIAKPVDTPSDTNQMNIPAPPEPSVSKEISKGIQDAFAQQEKGKLKVRPKPTNLLSNMQKTAQEKAKAKVRAKPKVATQQETPAKFKVKMKPQASNSVTDTDVAPRQWVETNDTPKMKVRLKPKTLTTPAGISVNGMADQLNANQASAEPVQADHEARTENTAQMVNSTMGTLPNRAVQVLKEKNNLETTAAAQTAEPVPQHITAPKVEPTVTRVSNPETSLSKDKVLDVISKIAKSEANRTAKSEAATALEGLGFKKKEFQKLLDSVDHIEKTEDKILAVLKLKGNPNAVIPLPPPAEKVPAAQVPAEVERVKEEQKAPAPTVPKSVPDAKVDNHVDTMHRVAKKDDNPLGLHPMPTSNSGMTPEQSSYWDARKPELPTPAAKPDTSDADQEKAKKDEEKAEREKKEKERKERDKKIEKQLDEITKALGSKGIFDLISMAISGIVKSLLGAMIGPILSALPTILTMLGPIAAIAATGAIAYEGTKLLLSHFGYDGSTIGGFLANQDGAAAKSNAQYQKSMSAFSTTLNKKLDGTGYTFNDKDKAYYKGNTKVGGADALPPDIRSKVSTATATAKTTQAQNVTAAAAAPPVPKSSVASAKISDAPPKTQTSDATPIIHQDNRKTIVQAPNKSSGSEGSTFIKVRNDEPSVSTLVSSIFDHPVSYGAVYRM